MRGPNYIADASFEKGTGPWYPYPRNTTRIGSVPQEHKVARRALRAKALAAFPFGISTGNVVGYPGPGSEYLLSAWVKAGTLTQRDEVTLELIGTTGFGRTAVIAARAWPLTNRWKKRWVFGRVRRADFTSLSAYVLIKTDVAIGAKFFVDAVRLVGGRGP